ncbi:hypothetical protein OJF2_64860 [Aquisphaera giovannonii]|uniref:Uncharacterized protein n=1 Tax=Aquisphaera giovannonii TaxID=406548 RepID=A0A5B9WC99_9BACT|nr:hypothetical protein [Aquisphaera giovannonii]QEH37894.1 hypothetical protein OJF2_64860 [Aquisphaera giovannonii]
MRLFSRQTGPRGAAIARGCLAPLAMLVALANAGPAPAGEPPRVARIRVPAAKVADWFPAGTPLRMISPAELDGLLRAAAKGDAAAGPDGPRLVRARHRARWDGKSLAGRSELVVEPPAAGTAPLALDPWTPTIRPAEGVRPPIGSLANGQAVVLLGPDAAPRPGAAGPPAVATVVLEWEQPALPDSEGRSFALGLPGDESTVLTLELPEGSTPTGPEGPREGPLAAAGAGERSWTFHGRPGSMNLRIHDARRPRHARDGDLVWVGGDTRIDLGPGPRLDPRAANWRAEWTVQPGARGSLEFAAELDPGLELVDVVGPDLREHRVTRPGGRTRIRVVLGRPAGPETKVTFVAHAKVPMEGVWSVPAIRPVDAVWTGGSTTIRLDPLRVVADCRERAGRRVPAAGDPGGGDSLVFEAESPQSVADLVFRAPARATTCRVFGRMKADGSGAGLECQVFGLGGQGTAVELEAELSPGWSPSRVAWGGAEQALAWNHAPMPGGGTRLRAILPAGEGTAGAGVLRIEATSAASAGRQPLSLPRVRPIGVAVEDEVWVAMADRGTRLTPTSARGLAWVDASNAGDPARFAPPPPGMQAAFAWRWVGDDGEARVDRDRIEPAAQAEVSARARIDRGGRRLLVEGEIAQSGPADPGGLPVWIGGPEDDASAWTFREADDGAPIASRPLTAEERARWGFPGAGLARSLDLPRPPGGKARVAFRAAIDWEGRGPVPLLTVPTQYRPRAVLLIEAPRELPTSARAVGASRIDAGVAERMAETWRRAGPQASEARDAFAVAHAFSYRDAGASVTLATTALPELAWRGVVRDATLTTLLHPDGPRPNRLRLLAQIEPGANLGFRLPAGASLIRARVDDEDAPVLSRDGGLAVVTPAAAASPRPRTIDLDYETAGAALADGLAIAPASPAVDIPCLSFTWELVAPPGWLAVAGGGDLLATDPEASPRWPFELLGVPALPWRGADRSASTVAEATWKRLDESLSGLAAGETALAGWLTRWDAAPAPVVVDRVSLAAVGYGPRTLCSIPRDATGESVARQALRRHGLALVPIDGALVVTTAAALPDFEANRAWKPAVGEALLWGSDRSDRLQGVARWRGEFTPGGAAGTPDSATFRPMPGWSAWHFAGVSWPGPSTRARIRDARAATAPGWAIAAGLSLAIASLGARMPARRALALPIALMAVCVAGRLWLGETLSGPLAGGFVGSATGLLLTLGSTISARNLRRQPAQGPGHAGVGIRLTRSMARITPPAAALLLLHAATAAGREDAPIPILFPYEGTYEPGRLPAQVVLRQGDYEALRRMARPAHAAEAPGLVLLEALHRVSWRGEDDLDVASDLTLLKSDGPAGRWIIPVDGSREIRATLDGQAVPVFIEPGGAKAGVSIDGAGRHELKVRRIVALRPGDASGGTEVPVNPHPSARLVVEKPPEGRQAYVPGLGGDGKPGADGSIRAAMGPAGRVEIRTGAPDGGGVRAAGTNMEGLLLYDIQPAGDRLRARFTYRGSSPLPRVSFLVDPALIPRSMKVPGLVAGTWGGTEEEPVWTARVDPPLRDGAVVELDLWRPRAKVRKGGPGGPQEGAAPAETGLDYPRLEPLQVDRYSGALGVRRPGHWTGRVEPLRGVEPLTDEGFVKLWGPLPDDRLTLCGTTRLGRDDRPEFRTEPGVARVRVRPALELTIEEGRILLQYDAELADSGGAIDHLDLTIPQGLEVMSVDSEGLTAWTRRSPRSVALRYDRPMPAPRRRLSIAGWIAVPEEAARRGGRAHRLPTPWIEVAGMESLPGSLAVASDVPASLAAPPGAVTAASAATAATAAKSPAGKAWNQAFRVDDQARLGTLSWTPAPPRVDVRIDSQVTLGPDAAEWVAALRLDVRGGPLESVRLRIPRPWAAAATARFDGEPPRRPAEDRSPASTWTLTPDRPIWGSRRLVIRSSIALTAGQEIQHPEIILAGASSVETYLALAYPEGSPLTTAGSSAFQQVAYAGRFRDEEFRLLPGMQARAFHVERDPWSLKVQLPPAPGASRGDADATARAVSAEMDLTVLPDRSVRGRSVFEVQPRSGRFLAVELPPGGVMLWATADQAPARPVRAADLRWLVPLGDRAASQVAVFWGAPPPEAGRAGAAWSQPIPAAGPDRVPARVTIRVPEGLAVRAVSGELEATTADRLIFDRADRIRRQAGEFINQMDRGSSRDREHVAGLLIAHELSLRGADRSIRWSSRHLAADRRERAERDLAVIQSARKGMLETLHAAALDDEIAAGQSYLGAGPAPSPAAISVAEPVAGDRMRGLGRPAFLLGMVPGLSDVPAAVTLAGVDQPVASEGETADRARSMLMLGVLAAMGLAAVVRPHPGAWGLFILGATLGLLAFLGGPLPTAAAALAAFAGRLSRGAASRPSRPAAEPSSLRPMPAGTA